MWVTLSHREKVCRYSAVFVRSIDNMGGQQSKVTHKMVIFTGDKENAGVRNVNVSSCVSKNNIKLLLLKYSALSVDRCDKNALVI